MLVTLTCSKMFYPPDEESPAIMPNLGQVAIVELAKALPDLVVASASRLDLDFGPEDMPENDIQVDIRKFHTHAVKIPDLSIHVQFEQPYPDERTALEVRHELIALMREQLQDCPDNPSWRLDMVWGPVHGCFMNADAYERNNW